MEQSIHTTAATQHIPWNNGKLVGQKAPLKLKDIWAIRVRLQIANQTRELAMFNLAIDSKMRSCDLMKLRVRDVCHGSVVANEYLSDSGIGAYAYDVTDGNNSSTERQQSDSPVARRV